MKKIWYLLRCPEGDEAEYIKRYSKLIDLDGIREVICFQYQRMIRYGGIWHLEKRILMPGCIFLSGRKIIALKQIDQGSKNADEKISLSPCRNPYWKEMCQDGNVIDMSKGVIRNNRVVISAGPLKGREDLIRRIDRHKRTANIEVPFDEYKKQVTVGLEIYEKQM